LLAVIDRGRGEGVYVAAKPGSGEQWHQAVESCVFLFFA